MGFGILLLSLAKSPVITVVVYAIKRYFVGSISTTKYILTGWTLFSKCLQFNHFIICCRLISLVSDITLIEMQNFSPFPSLFLPPALVKMKNLCSSSSYNTSILLLEIWIHLRSCIPQLSFYQAQNRILILQNNFPNYLWVMQRSRKDSWVFLANLTLLPSSQCSWSSFHFHLKIYVKKSFFFS